MSTTTINVTINGIEKSFTCTPQETLLRVLRRVSSESYFEGDALVTHSLVEIRDVE